MIYVVFDYDSKARSSSYVMLVQVGVENSW